MLLHIWEELKNYFLTHNGDGWASAVFTAIGLVVSYFMGLIGLIVRVVKAIFNKSSLEQYLILETDIKAVEKQFKEEAFFFDEDHEKKYFFLGTKS